MSKIVRTSKVRHVFCEPAKPQEQYLDLRLSPATGDQNYIKANGEYFAYAVPTGGGALTVVPLSRVGKLPPSLPCLDGHHGPVTDFDFDPFRNDIIATGGEDCAVKIWQIPPGGLVENLIQPLVDMREHQKKITVVKFHPTADGVLATGSGDATVKVWDVSQGACLATCDANAGLVQDLVWNYTGSMLAASGKDKVMSIIDPRTGVVSASVIAHEGSKTSKLCFLGPCDRLCSTGFSKMSKRQLKIWDPRKLAEPLSTLDIDTGSGVLMPFFDEDTNMLYVGGKGDGNIRYFEITEEEPFQFLLSDYRANTPIKGLCMLPKLVCDTTRTEVARFLKLTTSSVEPLSFILPRKSDQFQEDVYPDTYAGKASLSAEEFVQGKIAAPILTSMDPAKRSHAAPVVAATFVSTVKPSLSELEKELSSYRQYVVELQKLCANHHIQYPEFQSAA